MFKEAIEPALEEQGYSIEITEFSDYVQPNNALAENEIDVNMFQHSVYLKKFSEEHSLELTCITEIPTAAMGVFSNKYAALEEAADGATVAIPNDDTNLARALQVLAQTGIITIDPDIDAYAGRTRASSASAHCTGTTRTTKRNSGESKRLG